MMGARYNHDAHKGLVEICKSYLGFDHLIPFDGLRELV
jgi:hypothetical protein